MRAGDLDRRVTLRRFTVTKDAFNADTKTWADLATVSASREDIRDSERVQAQQVGAKITARFKIRYSSQVADLNPKDELVCEGVTFGIAAVKQIGRRHGLEITATALAD